jgi:hypothetical protein
VDSVISFSGPVAIPDNRVDSATATTCIEAECQTVSLAPVDGGATPFLTTIRPGLYRLTASLVTIVAPTGSATSGTARVTITSHGMVLYENAALSVVCTQGLEVCGSGSEKCDVTWQ